MVVEVKSPTASQSQVDDQLFGSGKSLAADGLQTAIDDLHPSTREESKTRQRREEDDSWDDLLGDLAADVGKNRLET